MVRSTTNGRSVGSGNGARGVSDGLVGWSGEGVTGLGVVPAGVSGVPAAPPAAIVGSNAGVDEAETELAVSVVLTCTEGKVLVPEPARVVVDVRRVATRDE
ncbi:hypothetical protein acdb102_42510 [Acidothermaceae bacterium B102]|nr:hypothetical protein acdb102_42510 [Acidothermaceae bacterium B102]